MVWGEVYNAELSGNEDAFVAKLDGDVTSLLAATFLGGSGMEEAWGIALDEEGHVYVTGFTESRDFPTTAGAVHEAYMGGKTDAFVVRFDNRLATLEASTFLGGPGEDRAQAIAVPPSTDELSYGIYVTGYGRGIEPTIVPCCAEHGGHRGRLDAFVTRLASDLTYVVDTVVLGGIADDRAFAIAVGGDDVGYGGGRPFLAITGCTEDPHLLGGEPTEDAYYPMTRDAYDTSQGRYYENAFVSVLRFDLAALYASTFLGGRSCGRAVAIDANNNVYVAGHTTDEDFPTSFIAYDETYNDRYVEGDAVCGARENEAESEGDAFVAKLSSTYSLSTLAAGTLLGGCAKDIAMALALTGAGNVYVAGYTYSSDFPTTDFSYYPSHSGRADGFVSKLDGDLAVLSASTFLGGSEFDAAMGLSLDGSGNLYVAGYTYSPDFPTTDLLLAMAGGGDAFVTNPYRNWAVPISQHFSNVSVTADPILNIDPDQAIPIGIGPIAKGGSNLRLRVATAPLSGAADIYLGVSMPDIAPEHIYLLQPDLTFRSHLLGVVPWIENITRPVDENLFGEIPTSQLSPGTYYVYLAITPSGQGLTGGYYLWAMTFEIN